MKNCTLWASAALLFISIGTQSALADYLYDEEFPLSEPEPSSTPADYIDEEEYSAAEAEPSPTPSDSHYQDYNANAEEPSATPYEEAEQEICYNCGESLCDGVNGDLYSYDYTDESGEPIETTLCTFLEDGEKEKEPVIPANTKCVVFKFGAKWCGPCVALAAPLATALQGMTNVMYHEFDVDKTDPAVLKKYGVPPIPMIIAWKMTEERSLVNIFEQSGLMKDPTTGKYSPSYTAAQLKAKLQAECK